MFVYFFVLPSLLISSISILVFILNHPCITYLDTEGDGHESTHRPEKYSEEYSEEDVERVLNNLNKHYYGLWKPIGIELGIDMGVISDIGRDHKGEFNCLQALIKQYPHSDNPTLTFKAIVQACGSKRVESAGRGTHYDQESIYRWLAFICKQQLTTIR